MSDTEYLVALWQTVKKYSPNKDRQSAADHVINDLVEQGISDEELESLAVDKPMLNAIKEHIDVAEIDEDDE